MQTTEPNDTSPTVAHSAVVNRPEGVAHGSRPGWNFLIFTAGVLIFTLAIFAAYQWRSLIIPLVISVVFWYLINLLARGFHAIPMAQARMPMWLSTIFAIVTICLAMWVIYSIVASQATRALQLIFPQDGTSGIDVGQLVQSIRDLLNLLPAWLPVELPTNEELAGSLSSIFNDLERSMNTLWRTTSSTINQVTATLSTVALILLYLAFIFMEQGTFQSKIKALTGDEANYKNWSLVAGNISRKLNSYVVIKLA